MSKQDCKLFIGGLSWETSDSRLRTYFENYGQVNEAFVSYDRHTGRPRGFGFVVFEDPAVAEKVVSLQHTIDRREVCYPGMRWRADCSLLGPMLLLPVRDIACDGVTLVWASWPYVRLLTAQSRSHDQRMECITLICKLWVLCYAYITSL